ncbi:MAG: hypothetical protein ICV62_13635 [Cyanobacteria bacterium Co-bin13]|nr:hypothetical protein [Cyanobacteria bacterium Co-bin13]
MKILETTRERLVIRRGGNPTLTEIVCLALWINIVSTFCFTAIPQNSNFPDQTPFIISFAIGLLLTHFLFPAHTKNESPFLYWFTVTFAAIPFLGIIFLPLAVMGMLLNQIQFPESSVLTFDKNENLLTIRSKFLYWHRTAKHRLSEITGASHTTQKVYTGSWNFIEVPVVVLSQRRQDGNAPRKGIYFPDTTDSVEKTVNLINEFLS